MLLSSGICGADDQRSPHYPEQSDRPKLVSGQRPDLLFERYCLDCHDEDIQKGNLDLLAFLDKPDANLTLVFENLVTGKMPPANKKQPSPEERQAILDWLAEHSTQVEPATFRRISRHEFVHSLNDLLGTNLDLASEIPEDRGTHDFDSNRKIQLSREMLGSYFSITDKLLEQAFPEAGFPTEQSWVTSKVRDSHETYRNYHRPYKGGILFSWTRANNGNSYSFIYDSFEPPVSGWYELTFEAAKVGDFPGDASLQVHAGKYYFADDRPQPQRLVDVISIADAQVQSYTIRGFFEPGESVSVHCYSPHTWRQANPKEGIYIKQLTVTGPKSQWPPKSYRHLFGELPLDIPDRSSVEVTKKKSCCRSKIKRNCLHNSRRHYKSQRPSVLFLCLSFYFVTKHENRGWSTAGHRRVVHGKHQNLD